MKVTKRQLRKIIKEEKAKLLEMNAGYVKLDRPAGPKAAKTMSKNDAHTALVETILELEKILGEAGVREALSELGY
tara:strand:- start:590 stop:817 length:228 start_codon:yes stop_codon:yes gene_type:complete